MNSDVPSSENELSQDGSSANDTTENSASSHKSNESSNQVKLSDDAQVEPKLNNDPIDTASDPELVYTISPIVTSPPPSP